MTFVVQSIRFNKNFWTIKEANEWILKNKYKIVPFGVKNPQYRNYHSYRQINPIKLVNIRTRKLYSKHMLFIIGEQI